MRVKRERKVIALRLTWSVWLKISPYGCQLRRVIFHRIMPPAALRSWLMPDVDTCRLPPLWGDVIWRSAPEKAEWRWAAVRLKFRKTYDILNEIWAGIDTGLSIPVSA